MMNIVSNRKPFVSGTGHHYSGDLRDQVPMHPDDFEAHLAWITAKRFHELVLKETMAEKAVCFRII